MTKPVRNPIVVLIALLTALAALMTLGDLGNQTVRGVIWTAVIALSVVWIVRMRRKERIEPTMPNAIRHWMEDDRNAGKR
jgi:Flp pilus assembly protein TadB